jgi:hypothetical protein
MATEYLHNSAKPIYRNGVCILLLEMSRDRKHTIRGSKSMSIIPMWVYVIIALVSIVFILVSEIGENDEKNTSTESGKVSRRNDKSKHRQRKEKYDK